MNNLDIYLQVGFYFVDNYGIADNILSDQMCTIFK